MPSTFTLGQLRTNSLRLYFPEIKEMTRLYSQLPDDIECTVENGADGQVECDIVLDKKGKPKKWVESERDRELRLEREA